MNSCCAAMISEDNCFCYPNMGLSDAPSSLTVSVACLDAECFCRVSLVLSLHLTLHLPLLHASSSPLAVSAACICKPVVFLVARGHLHHRLLVPSPCWLCAILALARWLQRKYVQLLVPPRTSITLPSSLPLTALLLYFFTILSSYPLALSLSLSLSPSLSFPFLSLPFFLDRQHKYVDHLLDLHRAVIRISFFLFCSCPLLTRHVM